MINGQEAELVIIDIPYVEMSVSIPFHHVPIQLKASTQYNNQAAPFYCTFYSRDQ